MWDAYLQAISAPSFDWCILAFGIFLNAAHLFGLYGRYRGRSQLFVQDLERYRTSSLAMTELLPIGGSLGTVPNLMATFRVFQASSEGQSPNLTEMVSAFSPAMSATASSRLIPLAHAPAIPGQFSRSQ